MLTFSPALETILKTASSKLDWVSKLNATLGSSRRIRCFRDIDVNSVDPFLTGEEFLNIGNTGEISGSSGNISSFGTVSNATIRKSANLSTGKSILRIEGNGHWVQGTLGLKNSGEYDFTMSVNPGVKSGVGMKAGMRAPVLLPSGTGPIAPPAVDNRPVYFELEDWRNPSNPVVVKSCVFSKRDEDMVFEDTDLAQDIGDVRITMLNDTIVYDDFEFGALLMSCNPVLNGQGDDVLHQVLVSCKPHNRWATYPFADTFDYFVEKNNTAPAGAVWSRRVGQVNGRNETITFVAKTPTVFSVTSTARGALPDLTVGTWYFGGFKEPDNITIVPKNQLAPWSVRINPSNVPIPVDPIPTDPEEPQPGELPDENNPTPTEPSPTTPEPVLGDYPVGTTFTWTIGMRFNENGQSDVTTPPPFKINLRDINNNVIYTYQMSDGLPINSPNMLQIRSDNEPARPLFNCGMMLPWSSSRPKENRHRYKNMPKAKSGAWRMSMSHKAHSFNAAVPVLSGRTQLNSLGHYFSAPRWGTGAADNALNRSRAPNYGDTSLFDYWSYFTVTKGPLRHAGTAIGWDYEPGSISLHDWYTGPGGPRQDRAVIPTAIALYHSNPTGRRLTDNSLFRDNVDAWNLAYFNHSCHYVKNVGTFEGISTSDVNAGKVAYTAAYYGGSFYVPGGETTHVALRLIPNAASVDGYRDRNGNYLNSGWGVDHLHAYCSPGWATLLYNSPMHVIAAKHRYNATMMSQLLQVSPSVTGGFLQRNGAWRWLNWAMNWKIATGHRLGISRKEIEDRWVKDIENIHATYVVPATIPSDPNYNSADSRALRQLGQTMNLSNKDGTYYYTLQHNGLAFYMTHVFLLMKRSGSWDVLYNKNTKCRQTLEFMLSCYDRHAVDMILDTDGRAEGGYPRVSIATPNSLPPDPSTIATSWADWAVKFPPSGVEDWIREADGSYRFERDVAQHCRYAWTVMRRDYFSEFPYPRLDEAIAKYEAYYDVRTQRVAEGSLDWTYYIPGFAPPSPASENNSL